MNIAKQVLAASFGALLLSAPVSADTVLEDTSLVVRGMTAEAVRAELGEALDMRIAGGDFGPVVEHWTYADGLVVVVQGGYVIDSFKEKQN